jgi:TolB protein
MKWIHFWVLILALILVSVVQAQEDELPVLPGHIAYVGTDANIYLLNLQDYTHEQLTDDAGETRRYEWPTWSTDGRLAYFSTSLQEGRVTTEAYISTGGRLAGELSYAGPEVFNYAYWSPGNCEAGPNCRDLSILLSSQTRGMFVELVRDGLESRSNLTAGLGGPPFYYSWSPDGGRMLWQRNNQRLDIYDANADEVVDMLEQSPGAIFAPAWSPVDDRLLVGVTTTDGSTDLMIVGAEEPITLAANLTTFVSYNWSPDGNHVAYREASRNGFGPVMVLDALTGETIARSTSTGAIAFFWSPDSQQVAYLTLASAGGTFSASHLQAQGPTQPVGIAWSILDVSSGEVRQYGQFFPTQETLYLMQFFDQFAQSHRIWSPDSRHLLYSEVTTSGPVINLLDTAQRGSVPISVAEGVIGIWSYE